jgi:hypothetical protein
MSLFGSRSSFLSSLALFGSFQYARLVHVLCTTGIVLSLYDGIVLFMIVHVSPAFLVSRAWVGRHVHRRAYTRPTPARIRNNLNRFS